MITAYKVVVARNRQPQKTGVKVHTENRFIITSGNIPAGDVVIYEYGVRLDKECITAAFDQISKSRRLYNEIVACIGVLVRGAHAYILEMAGPDAVRVQDEIDAFSERFKAAKADDDEPAMKLIAQERREKWHALSGMLKSVRKEHRKEIGERYLSKIGRNSSCLTYQIRSQAVANGLGWGTANAVLDAALQAFKKSFALGKAPRFAPSTEIVQDCLTLQFTAAGGTPAVDLLQGKQEDFALLPTKGCGPRKYGEFKFRLGAAKVGSYATGTWQYHRPLPEGANIGLARLVRRRVGQKFAWVIQLMVKTKEPVREVVGQRIPLATIHFGWAQDIDGRRVAAIADAADPGQARLVMLPPQVETALERSAELQAARDNARNEIAVKMRMIEVPDTAPEILVEIMGKLRRTRPQDTSANRLHYVCRLLRDENLLPNWLEEWRQTDKLRWQDQVHIAKRARNIRKTFYRELAIGLGRQYDAIAIEPLDLGDAALKVDETTGEKTEFAKKARAGRVVVALYELESAIRWAASKTQAALLEIKGPTATQCAICGGTVEASKDDYQTLNCQDCGAELDRKRNGAARAWQAVNEQREDAVTDFWNEFHAATEAKALKKSDKLLKLAEGRRKARTPTDGAEA